MIESLFTLLVWAPFTPQLPGRASPHPTRPARFGPVLLFIALALAAAAAGCSASRDWNAGVTRDNTPVMESFFADWCTYMEGSGADPASIADIRESWADDAFSSDEVSFVSLALTSELDLEVTASLGTVERVEVSAHYEENPTEEQSKAFIAACEAVVYAYIAEKTAAGPELLVTRLFDDLSAASKRSDEDQLSADVAFARRSFRLREDQLARTVDFIATV